MNVFLSGATGYLGYHIARQCIKEGHNILCLRRHSSVSLFSENEEKLVKWITIGEEGYKKKIDTFAPEVLIHAAWAGVRGSDRNNAVIQSENLSLSRELFCQYPYKQIIALGSQAEYGFYEGPVSEDYPLNPTTEYGKAKVICCKELQTYCESHNIEWQWVRVFTVFGEKQTGGLIKFAIEKFSSKEKTFSTTEGKQIYSYLYAGDFAQSICNMLGVVGNSGIYNISQPKSLRSNREVLECIKTLIHSNIVIDYGAIPYTKGQIMLMDGKVEKYEKYFGIIPNTDFVVALKNTIDSFL